MHGIHRPTSGTARQGGRNYPSAGLSTTTFVISVRSITTSRHAASPGTPLRYRRTAGAFLLYSLGPDRRDNGGTPQRRPTGQEDPGDLVAGRFWPDGKTYPILGAPVPI